MSRRHEPAAEADAGASRLDRALIAAAAACLPQFSRARHREEWLTDAAAAPSAGMRSGAIGLGALVCAVTNRGGLVTSGLVDAEELVLGRLRHAVGWLAIFGVSVVAALMNSLSMDMDLDAANSPTPAMTICFGAAAGLFGAVAAVALVLGLVALWQSAPRRRGGSRPLVAFATVLTTAIGLAVGVQAVQLVAGDDGQLAGLTEPTWLLAMALGMAGAFGTVTWLAILASRRPAAPGPAATAPQARRLALAAWLSAPPLVLLGLAAALVAAPRGVGMSPSEALRALGPSAPYGVVPLAIWAAITLVGAGLFGMHCWRVARPTSTDPRPEVRPRRFASARGLQLTLLAILALIPALWWQASFSLGMSFADELGTTAPHLSFGDLYPVIGQLFTVAAIWLAAHGPWRRLPSRPVVPAGVPTAWPVQPPS